MSKSAYRWGVTGATALILLALISSTSCVVCTDGNKYTYKSEFEESYGIRQGGSVTVKNVDGYVRATPWDKDEVLVKGTLRIRARSQDEASKIANDVKVIISHDDNSFSLEVKKKSKVTWLWCGSWCSWNLDLDLYVPRECEIDFSAVDGSVYVTGVKGNVDVNTVDGSVEVSEVRGDISCETVDGKCSVTDVEGRVDVSTVDGSLVLSGIFKGLRASTVDGSIRAWAEEGSVNSDGWKLSTVDGSITLKIPRSVSCEVQASSTDGHISVSGAADYAVKSKRKVVATLGSGGAPVRVSTTDGSITVEYGEE